VHERRQLLHRDSGDIQRYEERREICVNIEWSSAVAGNALGCVCGAQSERECLTWASTYAMFYEVVTIEIDCLGSKRPMGVF
jgi:hypothetical protein